MALVLADRVKETTTTTGTGTVTLAGAATGFQSFAVVGNGNTTYYTIAGQGTAEWEVGIGTYTSVGTTLSRTTVLASSNAGSLVTFSAGTKDVFVTYPAGRSIYADGTTLTATNSSILPVSSGGTGASTLTANNVLLGNGTTSVQFVAPGTSGNVLTSNGTTWTSAAASGAFAAGTALLFYQATAPTGWTKSVTNNDKTLRVVSGSTGGSAGGTTAFSTVFANQTPTITTSGLSAAATTLSQTQIPSHTHTVWNNWTTGGTGAGQNAPSGTANTGGTGGGGSHTHTIAGSATSSAITLNVQYIDVIVCTKD